MERLKQELGKNISIKAVLQVFIIGLAGFIMGVIFTLVLISRL